jgi:hypothetical protein
MRLAVLLVLVVLLASCAPYAARAPIGQRDAGYCEWVRRQVANGSLPIEQAQDFYSECEPFEGPE